MNAGINIFNAMEPHLCSGCHKTFERSSAARSKPRSNMNLAVSFTRMVNFLVILFKFFWKICDFQKIMDVFWGETHFKRGVGSIMENKFLK